MGSDQPRRRDLDRQPWTRTQAQRSFVTQNNFMRLNRTKLIADYQLGES
jgi:hypothetical protein